MFIDADTHVDECEETWAHIPKGFEDMLPRSIDFPEGEMPSFLSGNRSSGSGYYRMWLIDGQLFPHRVRSDERTGTTVATRELHDVGARVKHMDELGVETQVIFPDIERAHQVVGVPAGRQPDRDVVLTAERGDLPGEHHVHPDVVAQRGDHRGVVGQAEGP